jgi:hypothetical protein
MKSGEDQSDTLYRLQREGQITSAEFEHLAGGRIRPTSEDAKPSDDPAEETSAETAGGLLASPKLRSSLSVAHVVALALAAVLLSVFAFFGFLPWTIAIAAVVLLATTLIEGWRKVTLTGTAVMAIAVVVGVLGSAIDRSPSGAPQPLATVPTTGTERTAPPGSLGLYMDEVTDRWNSIDGPPEIVRGLTRQTEIGEYHSFIYRFGDWGRLAGAYDPDDEAVHALLATGRLSEAPTSQMYLRLCFMVAPYSPDCLDAYHEQGLGGANVDNYLDTEYRAEWRVDGHTWRLVIERNVLTLRVFGADAA